MIDKLSLEAYLKIYFFSFAEDEKEKILNRGKNVKDNIWDYVAENLSVIAIDNMPANYLVDMYGGERKYIEAFTDKFMQTHNRMITDAIVNNTKKYFTIKEIVEEMVMR